MAGGTGEERGARGEHGARGARGEQGQIVDGRFELLSQLGAGGMGTVWRALDTALHREVAIKEVRPPLADLGDPAWQDSGEDSQGQRALRERVLREARALARLSHPNVVTIHHIVDEGPYPWLVMELVPGSLEARLDEGPLEPQEAARLGREVLGALRTSHAAGIQHRDVKPANVLLRADGSAVLTDFGIAALQGSASVTATGEFLGSPEYIAPERIRGTDDDPASDLWSLALTLYVCTERHSPLRRATTLATLAAVLDDPVPPPVRSGALGPVLEAVLVRDETARPGPAELDRMLADAVEGRAAVSYLPTQAAMPVQPPPQPGTDQPGPVSDGHTQHGFGPPPGDSAGNPDGTGGGSRDGGNRKRGGRVALTVASIAVAAALTAGGVYALARSGDDTGGQAGEKTGQPATTPSAGPSDNGNKPSGPGENGGNGGNGGNTGNGGNGGNPTKSPPNDGPNKPAPNGPVNTWVAQIGSVPKSQGPGARDKMAATLNAKTDAVRYVDTDRFASLRSGHWMFYHSTSTGFPNGQRAAAWCSQKGLSVSNDCVGRYVSNNEADRVFVCAPDKNGPTGRCRR